MTVVGTWLLSVLDVVEREPGQKEFHTEPCTWTYTVLWEELWVEDVEWERRPVHVDKFPPPAPTPSPLPPGTAR